MRPARAVFSGFLLLLLAAPVAAPFLSTFSRAGAWSVWSDAERILDRMGHTLLLAVGAMVVAVPVGTVGGVTLARVRFPGRPLAVGLTVIGAFIPLPIYAVAWQVILSGWVPGPEIAPGVVAWRPWMQGLAPAAWVHGTAAIPWVIGIVAAGISTADRGLEEAALVAGGPLEWARRVGWPRVFPAAAVGAVWVSVQCATEIAVTDAMMVRTVAEEAYTQLVVGYAAGAAATAAVTLPFLLLAAGCGVAFARKLDRTLPAESGELLEPLDLLLSQLTRIAVVGGVAVCGLVLAGLPLAAVVWKAAGGGRRDGAGVVRLGETVFRLARTDGLVLGESLVTSATAGGITAALAWVAAGIAVRCRWMQFGLLTLCIGIWLTPAPLVGFGLKEVFDGMMTVEESAFQVLGSRPDDLPVRSLVYDRPSPVPVVWASVIRFFPLALAVVWVAVRAVPDDLFDLAAVDGLGVTAYFRMVISPATASAFPVAVVAVAALALGEVGAGKIVAPPGYRAFVLELFAQMHYGTDATVCGLCLLQLAAVAGVALLFSGLLRTWNTARRPAPIPPVRPG